jgi:hypothetical protein
MVHLWKSAGINFRVAVASEFEPYFGFVLALARFEVNSKTTIEPDQVLTMENRCLEQDMVFSSFHVFLRIIKLTATVSDVII